MIATSSHSLKLHSSSRVTADNSTIVDNIVIIIFSKLGNLCVHGFNVDITRIIIRTLFKTRTVPVCRSGINNYLIMSVISRHIYLPSNLITTVSNNSF